MYSCVRAGLGYILVSNVLKPLGSDPSRSPTTTTGTAQQQRSRVMKMMEDSDDSDAGGVPPVSVAYVHEHGKSMTVSFVCHPFSGRVEPRIITKKRRLTEAIQRAKAKVNLQ